MQQTSAVHPPPKTRAMAFYRSRLLVCFLLIGLIESVFVHMLETALQNVGVELTVEYTSQFKGNSDAP